MSTEAIHCTSQEQKDNNQYIHSNVKRKQNRAFVLRTKCARNVWPVSNRIQNYELYIQASKINLRKSSRPCPQFWRVWKNKGFVITIIYLFIFEAAGLMGLDASCQPKYIQLTILAFTPSFIKILSNDNIQGL